ncbi:hypothetical protein F4553_004739 [Allocatelliglobosispora scoriae]|uniref:ARB-07466-like C-terminal domain-containing protein n=1 Tax=Allocatelliglobosispora scoriae TaxID=643052 RepID=A0A841BXA6_9ACTN|nr:hypothetical protein [Allocatelliglobosispora scoriae]MBB5871360.1 hypothetical protein [Allocatelliglobosispora scoriae]
MQNLEAASTGFLEAEAALDASRRKQLDLAVKLRMVEAELGPLRKEVGDIAGIAYQTGRLGTVGALLASNSPDAFLGRAMMLETMTQRQNIALSRLVRAQAEMAEAKSQIDIEVKKQASQAAEMEKRRKATELALSTAGGRKATGWVDPNSPVAKAAKRNSDGSWPRESATVNDPTTSGRITPRTMNALTETLAAKDPITGKKLFNRFVSCYRPGGPYEHPKGRACDWSTVFNGFENANATGDERIYGDRLASFYIKNASRLGVLYVIWYRRIWTPAVGWHNYSGKGGPAGEHTNHVHLSML